MKLHQGGNDVTVDEAGIGEGLMRRERNGRRVRSHVAATTASTEIRVGFGPTHVNENRRVIFERVDPGGLQCLANGEQGEDRGQSIGSTSFCRAGRAGQQNVVAAGRGTFKGAPGGLLTGHIF